MASRWDRSSGGQVGVEYGLVFWRDGIGLPELEDEFAPLLAGNVWHGVAGQFDDFDYFAFIGADENGVFGPADVDSQIVSPFIDALALFRLNRKVYG